MSKTAIVTGASRGIGRAIAQRLSTDGFNVVVNYAGNATQAEKLASELAGTRNSAIAIQADVANPTDIARLFQQAKHTYGSIDVVVHNAGIMPLAAIGKDSLETFDLVIRTNLRGAFVVLAEAVAHLSEGGRIIALSSSVLAKNFPTYGPYIASKAGVEGLVHVLTNEMRGRQVTVNAVAPGPTGTDLFLNGKTQEQIDQLSKLSPLERLGEPDDIARVVSFLAGPDGGWVNGQIIRVNGGFA